MNFCKSTNLFLFFIFLSFELSAQDFFFDTEVINIEQGLPNRRTYEITQDLEGFIWVSTPGKISRYDGNNFKNYNADFLNINESLPTFLAIDDANLLWYCEYSSYSITNETGIINTKTNEVQNIETFSKGLIQRNSVSFISTSDVTSAILIETKNGLIYSYEAGLFTLLYEFEEAFEEKTPSTLKEFEKGVYWYSKGSQLYKIEAGEIISNFSVPNYIIDIDEFQATYVIKTLVRNDRKLWKLEHQQIVPFEYDEFSEPNITHIQNTFKEHYFICSDKIIFKNQFNETIFKYEDIAQTTTVKDKVLKIQDVFLDKQNVHWITTENGLIKINVQKNYFQTIEKENSIRGIYKTDKNLWIGGYYKNTTPFSKGETAEIIPKNSNISIVGFAKDT